MAKSTDVARKIVDTVENYVKESEEAKRWRMTLNQQNFEMYHGRQDMGHKLKGQSKEFLPRQSMGVEHVAQFLHQGLLDFGDFFSANVRPGYEEREDTVFTANQVRELIKWQLDKADFYNHTLDVLKSGILGALLISKIGGKMVPKRRYVLDNENPDRLLRDTDKAWQLKLSTPRQRNFHPDPSGKGLYIVEEIEIDAWELQFLADEHPGMFDKKVLKQLLENAHSGSDYEMDRDKESETNQPNAPRTYRRVVKLREVWGHILDPDTGQIMFETRTCLVAEDQHLLAKPRRYPSWDQEHPYVKAALLRTPNSEWHKALADFPTMLNKALNEVYNLLLDSGIQAVFGLKQVRENWLEDPSEIDEGIYPGMTVGVNASCPPGAKVIERLDTNSAGAGEALSVFNLTSQEHNQAMMQNDTRTGSLPARAVKATEIVATENASTSVFSGVAKSIEMGWVEPTLSKIWTQLIQNFKKLDKDELMGILGEEEFERINKLTAKQLFQKSYGAFSFKVFGITQTLNKVKDFRKLTGLLQAVSGNPQLMEAFVRKYSFTKLLGEIVKALDVNEDRIKLPQVDQQLNQLDGEEAVSAPNATNMMDGQMTQLAQPGAGQFEEEAGGGATFSEVGSFAGG